MRAERAQLCIRFYEIHTQSTFNMIECLPTTMWIITNKLFISSGELISFVFVILILFVVPFIPFPAQPNRNALAALRGKNSNNV